MRQTLRQRRVLCKDPTLKPRDEPAVLRVQPPAPPPKRIIREDAPPLGMMLRIAIWTAVVTAAALVQAGVIPSGS